ncbi:MAG TPA: GGDEF domain-containing protein [Thermoanaerobaculia bacterium]|nr:GGDEF domain-containing protein [Thermoanaerobaculia bacterium]
MSDERRDHARRPWAIYPPEPRERRAAPRATHLPHGNSLTEEQVVRIRFQRKKRGLQLATTGLLLALTELLILKATGFTSMSSAQWVTALVLTLIAEGSLWMVLQKGLTSRIPSDPDFVLLPMLVAAGLIAFYVHVAPEARALAFIAWFAALLFLIGIAGFWRVTVLSSVMCVAYLAAIIPHALVSNSMSTAFEVTVALLFLVTSIYCGIVFEKVRKNRRETRALRLELAELAGTDPLTGLPNRRRVRETLPGELERIRRHGGHCTVVMLDVDHFKAFNDQYGHPAGDAALRQLAGLLRRSLRVSDSAIRYGGEEFGLIMPDTTAEAAYGVVDRLRDLISSHPFNEDDDGEPRLLTVSAGLATCPDDGTDYETLLGKADDALYRAKRLGRNRIELAA